MLNDVKVVLPDGTARPLTDYWWPTAVLMLAAFLLALSLFLPYWSMTMHAPQYPQGLKVEVYVNRLAGDVQEVDELNHYLGMPPLDEGGRVERTISVVTVTVMALLLLAGIFIHNRWVGLAVLPAVAYPAIFLADLKYILYHYGHSIDPHSALGGAIAPFTPPLLGIGTIGQFSTEAVLEPGLYLALAASALLVAALWLHRRAYRPLYLARQAVRRKSS